MLRGLFKLTWVELKIFLREPMGAIGTIGVPVLMFVVLGRIFQKRAELSADVTTFVAVFLPIFATILIALSNVLSLTAIISIYREHGILKRLKATPLRAQTILITHVIVKLLLTVATLFLLVLAGKTFYTAEVQAHPLSFAAAMLLSMLSILSIGFVIASIVPTARFAQPVGSVILYPMLAFSGLFFPLDALPEPVQVAANLLPLTHAVGLLQGIWTGGAWSDHLWQVAALVANFVVCTVLAGKIFRWE
ncbi:MAG: ABC transporter permease [bacterium]|nr:ABC transporter permease [bacterium]